MKYVASFVLVLIGLILGFVGAVFGILKIYLLRAMQHGALAELINDMGIPIGGMFLFSIITSVIGIALCIALLIYLIRIAKTPTKTDFIVTTVLGGVGTITGMGVGGILVLIGGIIGIVQVSKK